MEFQNICNEMVAPFLLRHPVVRAAQFHSITEFMHIVDDIHYTLSSEKNTHLCFQL